jgi:predicted ATP-dependent serine protease
MCEKCGNKIGFAFGTCCECGWNHLDKTYHIIKVNVSDLPDDIKYLLIQKHNKSVQRYK